HGGFFAQVDRSGKPEWDGLKHPHAVTYAAETFACAEPFLPAGEGMAWARRALAWLEDVAWGPLGGGGRGGCRGGHRALSGRRPPAAPRRARPPGSLAWPQGDQHPE